MFSDHVCEEKSTEGLKGVSMVVNVRVFFFAAIFPMSVVVSFPFVGRSMYATRRRTEDLHMD